MERDFSSLSNPAFDMLVIGGGATGAAIAWDATLRGLRAVSYTHLTLPTN